MRYFIKIEELSDKPVFIETKLQDILEKIKELEKLKEQLTWEGSSKDAFIIKYDQYINDLKKMSNRIIKIIVYLKSYYQSYDNEYDKLKNKYNQLLNEEVVR